MKFEKIHNKGQARLFQNPYLEMLTKANPLVIWGMYLPVLSYLLIRAKVHFHFSSGRILLTFLAGMFFWTFFEYIAEEVREILASLGFRTLQEAIGHVEYLDTRAAVDHWKASGLDLSPLLVRPEVDSPLHRTTVQDHGLAAALDNTLIDLAKPALDKKEPVRIDLPVRNVNRTVGTMLGAEITRRYGAEGLPFGTIDVTLHGHSSRFHHASHE